MAAPPEPTDGFRAVEQFAGQGAEPGRKAVDAVLALNLDGSLEDVDRLQLIRSLRVAQGALRGERARTERAEARTGGSGAAINALSEAQAENRALTERLDVMNAELDDKRAEVNELTDMLAQQERGGGGSRRISVTSTGTTSQEQRQRIEELEASVRQLRVKTKELTSEGVRKDEMIDLRSRALEELRSQVTTEREEHQSQEEEVRVMRAQLRDYREKLEVGGRVSHPLPNPPAPNLNPPTPLPVPSPKPLHWHRFEPRTGRTLMSQ